MRIQSTFAATILALATPFLRAEERVFQNGSDQYEGFNQMVLQGNFESRRTEDLSKREILKAVGVPWGGERTMFLVRFDDLFDPAKGGLKPTNAVRAARLELYKLKEIADPQRVQQAEPGTMFVHVHDMRTPFYVSDSGYSCFSYRRWGGNSEELYWGTENRMTEGPVMDVDYDKAPIGRIPIEVDSEPQWYGVDVTKAISEAREKDGSGGCGFYIRALQYWMGLEFASGEHPDVTLRPKLVVEYD